MIKTFRRPRAIFLTTLLACVAAASSHARSQGQPQPQQQQPPAVEEWTDEFDGERLDESKWEPFSFQGAGGGKVEVREGELRLRGPHGSRFGVRSRRTFTADRFIVEAAVTKTTPPLPAPGSPPERLGHSVLAVMFDGTGRNRVEWILTSEGQFEAWSVVDGRGERLDNRRLGTKIKDPVLGVVRRGDEFLFMLNGQEGLRSTIKNLPRTFHVMLYGNSSSESHWASARVVAAK
jgi:hypothetical protein